LFLILYENACKVEKEAYASSEEEAPEDEEPLEVNKFPASHYW